MPTHTGERGDAAATPRQRLLDGWRDVSSTLRRLAQSLGHAESCTCGDGVTDGCQCGVSVETQEECLQCAVLLHTVVWRIEELLDAQWFRPAGRDVLNECGANESTATRDAVRGCFEALTRTLTEIETFTREFGDGCSAGSLPVVRRFAAALLAGCSALDEALGFPRASRGRS